MEDELLKELDSILQPAISRSWECAKRKSLGDDPREAFLDLFKIEIDNTRVHLSNVLHKIDISTQAKVATSVERAAADFDHILPPNVEELPDVDASTYVKETLDDIQVWNGMRWVTLSKQANFKVEVFQDPSNQNRPAVRVWAKDDKTKTSVLYVDNDIEAPGWALALTKIGDFDESMDDLMVQDRYWEDPFYQIAKNSRAVGNITTGALTINQIANFTSWKSGDALKYAEGWYRNKEGIYEQLSKQRSRGGGGYQKSAQRAASKAKIFKSTGKVLLVASVAFSGYEIIDATRNDYTNKGEVITKASVDITISLIGAFGGPVGWAIAGTYFILNVSGAFGDWGTPSGISQSDYNEFLGNKFRLEHGDFIKSLMFETDYSPTLKRSFKNDFLEDITIKRDNTRVVMPKLILEKF